MPPAPPLDRTITARLLARAGAHRGFGLPLLPAAFLLSVGYAAQLFSAILSARGHRLGHLLNLAVALVWLVGAVTDHLDDVLFAEDYRRGFVSKALELGVMATAVAWVAVSLHALRTHQAEDARDR